MVEKTNSIHSKVDRTMNENLPAVGMLLKASFAHTGLRHERLYRRINAASQDMWRRPESTWDTIHGICQRTQHRGDFINDFEGIGGHRAFRVDLGLMYFPTLEAETGRLLRLELVPTQLKRLRVQRASPADARWLRELLDREGRRFGTSTEPGLNQRIELKWKKFSDLLVPNT